MPKQQSPNRRNLKTKPLNVPKSVDRETVGSGRNRMPSIAPAAVWSFLKETRGELSWTTDQMGKTLNIAKAEAADILTILEAQGYVQPNREDAGWITTPAGEEISGSQMPRYTIESVNHALSELDNRIKKIIEDPKAEFTITNAVAFGDFLSKRARVQAADVGVALDDPKQRKPRQNVKRVKLSERAFLGSLRGKTQLLKIVHYEPWMGQRSHRSIL